jgi:hypothetical protein
MAKEYLPHDPDYRPAVGAQVDLVLGAWVPMRERPPPPDTWLLVTWGNHRAVDKAHTFTKWKHRTHPLGYLIQGHPGAHTDVTHWQPLPAPPQSA